MPSILKSLLGRETATEIVPDADVNHYYVALINEARTEDERIALGRAAQRTMRRRRAAH